MAAIPEDLYRELVDEFGDAASGVAERALRSEITRHRITIAIARGVKPAAAVAEALARDPGFVAGIDRLADAPGEPGSLKERRRRWG